MRRMICSYYSTYTVHLCGFKMHYAYTFLPQTCTQVHVVFSEVESESRVHCVDETELSDDAENEEEDLSDTEPEDEWNTSDLPLSKIQQVYM